MSVNRHNSNDHFLLNQRFAFGDEHSGGPHDRLRPDIEHPYENFLSQSWEFLYGFFETGASLFSGLGISENGITANFEDFEMHKWVYFGDAPDHWQEQTYTEPWQYVPPSPEELQAENDRYEAELDNMSATYGPYQADFRKHAEELSSAMERDGPMSLTPGLDNARNLNMGGQFAAAGAGTGSFKIDDYRPEPEPDHTATWKPPSVA